jgi:alcohol dehydrogenase class IV
MGCCHHFAPTEGGASSFTVEMPRVTFGRGCLSELGERAAGLGLKRVALFTDPFLRDGLQMAIATQALRRSGLDHAIFDAIRIEPDQHCVDEASRFLREGGFDGVVSVGGGSVMDTAKAAMLYALYPADFLDYFGPPVGGGLAVPVPGPVLPHIACPTTAGTGSETTGLSVLRINQLDCKFVIGSRHLIPDEALIDPACIDTLPRRILTSSSFDLMSHALECYTARAYTQWPEVADPMARPMIQGANPWSDIHAREALRIVGQYLVRGVTDAEDHEARDKLMWAASLAGMAFGNSGTHLPHALSYAITHLVKDRATDDYPVAAPFVPHGISVIVNAPSVFRFTASAAPARHLDAARYLGADTRDASEDDAGEILAGRMIELMAATDMPNGIGDVGFGVGDATRLADSAHRQRRAIGNAPRETKFEDIEHIFRHAVSYW